VVTANNARAQFERSKALAAQRFTSRAALDKAETDYKAAQAATERGFATIVAPYSGVVSARHVELGEMANTCKALMTGFDPSTLRAVANVPQTRMMEIQSGGGRVLRFHLTSNGWKAGVWSWCRRQILGRTPPVCVWSCRPALRGSTRDVAHCRRGLWP